MSRNQRKLLNSSDLRALYKVTNPKLTEKPNLLMVIRRVGEDWAVENTHSLRGYRGCQTNLESRVRQYESSGHWPTHCDIGIGIFESEQLTQVLMAIDLGCKSVQEHQPTLPLDNILGSMGLTRSDVQK
jgi:hypothetical protein